MLDWKRMCSWIYVSRVYLWRYCEVLCRVCLIVCMWVVCGGVITLVWLLCEYVILFILYLFWKKDNPNMQSNILSTLSSLISVPFLRSPSYLRRFVSVRISFSVIALCLCVLFSYLNLNNQEMDTWYIIIACLLFIWPWTPFWIARNHKYILSNSDNAGVGRSIQELRAVNDFTSMIELELFGAKWESNKNTKEDLCDILFKYGDYSVDNLFIFIATDASYELYRYTHDKYAKKSILTHTR